MASEKVNIVIKAVDKTKRSFRAVTMGLNAIKKVAFSMQSALIAVGVAGFGFLIKKSMDATDALGKMADKIGIGTAELGGLRHAAELTGVATTTLDMGLQRMVRRISEAASGSGEAKDALIELGLSAKALNAMSPDQQFRAIADAMEGVAGQGEKVRLAMRLFDTEGVALVNTLNGGSAALIKMESEAERLGLRLSRGLVKGVEKANDSIGTLTTYIATLFHRIVGELAPAIESVTKGLMGWFELKVDEAGGPAMLASKIAMSVLDASETIITAFRDMTESIYNFVNTSGKVLERFHRWLGDTEFNTGEDLIFTGDAFDTAIYQISDMRTNLEILQRQYKATADAGSSIGDVSSSGTTLVDLTAMNQSQIMDLQDNYQSMYLGKQIAHDNLILKQQASAEKIALSYAARHKGKMLNLTHLYLTKQSAIQKASQEALKNTSTTITEDIIAAYKSTTDSIEETLTDAMMGTKSWGESMKGIFRQVAREYVLTNMARPFIKSITSALPTFDGGGFTGGGSRSGGVDGKGGFNAVLHPNETVIDHTKQQGNGSSTNISFNIQANDARGFDQLLQERRGQIVGMINQAMNENGQRAIA